MSKIIRRLIGRHVSLVLTLNNQPSSLESTINLFSGVLEDLDDTAILLRYPEGTCGIFPLTHVVGILESEIVEESPINTGMGDQVGQEEQEKQEEKRQE